MVYLTYKVGRIFFIQNVTLNPSVYLKNSLMAIESVTFRAAPLKINGRLSESWVRKTYFQLINPIIIRYRC